jgi:exonuclease III
VDIRQYSVTASI